MTHTGGAQDATAPRTARPGSCPAAFTLIVLTPLIAELTLGSTPIRLAWLVLLWVPVYGAGVLLIRELVTRRGRGWPSLLLLAAAYELVEDGIGLQALTSPHLYGAADWGLRVFGLNAPYWEANVLYHAVFTVAIPVALTELLFPGHRGRPYLGRTGTTVAGVVTLLGVGILRITVPPSQDPGYQAPLPFLAGCLLCVLLLALVALTVLPPVRRPPAIRIAVPSRPVLFAAGGLVTLVFFALTFPVFGSRQPAFTHGGTVLIPMLAAAALAAASWAGIRRMANSAAWSNRHVLALIGGALVAHSLGGLVIMAHTTIDRAGLLALIALTVVALWSLDHRLATRERQSREPVATPAR